MQLLTVVAGFVGLLAAVDMRISYQVKPLEAKIDSLTSVATEYYKKKPKVYNSLDARIREVEYVKPGGGVPAAAASTAQQPQLIAACDVERSCLGNMHGWEG